LSNGQEHTVSLSVYNADNYFSATASLLLYTIGGTQTSGRDHQNTLDRAVSGGHGRTFNVQPTSITGTVDVSSKRSFVFRLREYFTRQSDDEGCADWRNFFNDQTFNINGTKYVQEHLSKHHSDLEYDWCPDRCGQALVYNQDYTGR